MKKILLFLALIVAIGCEEPEPDNYTLKVFDCLYCVGVINSAQYAATRTGSIDINWSGYQSIVRVVNIAGASAFAELYYNGQLVDAKDFQRTVIVLVDKEASRITYER